MRRCSSCGEEKDESEFYRHKNGHNKVYCKKCSSSYGKRYYKLHKGEIIEKCAVYWKFQFPTLFPGEEENKTKLCKILHTHKELLKDDPERLKTSFIKELIGAKKSACSEVEE